MCSLLGQDLEVIFTRGHFDSIHDACVPYPTPGISGVPPQRPGSSSGRKVKLGGGVAGDLAGITNKACSQVGRHAKYKRTVLLVRCKGGGYLLCTHLTLSYISVRSVFYTGARRCYGAGVRQLPVATRCSAVPPNRTVAASSPRAALHRTDPHRTAPHHRTLLQIEQRHHSTTGWSYI